MLTRFVTYHPHDTSQCVYAPGCKRQAGEVTRYVEFDYASGTGGVYYPARDYSGSVILTDTPNLTFDNASAFRDILSTWVRCEEIRQGWPPHRQSTVRLATAHEVMGPATNPDGSPISGHTPADHVHPIYQGYTPE